MHGAGANPWRVIDMARDKLRLNAAAVQIPIGLEEHHAVRAWGEGLGGGLKWRDSTLLLLGGEASLPMAIIGGA